MDLGINLTLIIFFLIHSVILIHVPLFRDNPFFLQGLVRNVSLILFIDN
jgi:hypothetical protein